MLFDDKNRRINQMSFKSNLWKILFLCLLRSLERNLILVKRGFLVYEYNENYNRKQIGNFDKDELDLGIYIYFF